MNITDAMPDNINISGIEIIDIPGFLEFVVRFALNTVVVIILVRWLYYSITKRKDYLFTYILISSVVFLLCFLLESVKLQIGFALGLFEIFGIIRYRTNSIPIKEMTYLFLVIGISVINALTSTRTSLADLLFTNLVLIFITYGLEKIWLLKHESSKIIIYEKINLIKPENYEDLLNDLRERTGIKTINRVETGKIDFLKDTCTLTIFYETTGTEIIAADQNENSGEDDDD
jgi:Domain of unknown function (DUF4956)